MTYEIQHGKETKLVLWKDPINKWIEQKTIDIKSKNNTIEQKHDELMQSNKLTWKLADIYLDYLNTIVDIEEEISKNKNYKKIEKLFNDAEELFNKFIHNSEKVKDIDICKKK